MEHSSYLVDIVNKAGNIVTTKKRKDINKKIDLYHTVFVIIRVPENKLLLSRIPEREDLHNLYSEKLGLTAATIRRHDETADMAGLRVVKNELGLDKVQLVCIGESPLQLPDRSQFYASVYLLDHPTPKNFSHLDISDLQTVSMDDLEKVIKVNQVAFAPTFLAVWREYRDKLLSD